ncbi:MAG: hypothetical protein AMJ81_12885 [Phycisphaerae bacterium SM23_33]|nr:MAG: hypothetical protein AMJ81_12885 [Phycisphaerae bacterium SM23_33]
MILGLVIAAALAAFGYINDVWMFFSYIGGDLIPTYAYGLLLIGLLLVNPLLRLIRAWRFQSSEWAVILSMAFMGSVIAGSALLWQFPHPIITPIQEQAINPGWKAKDLLQYVPEVMMVDVRPTPDNPAPDALKYYMTTGLPKGEKGFLHVPWAAWGPALSFWFALLGLTFIAGICAVVVVHRQWSTREHLSYPIVTFANELIGHDDKGLFNPIFRRKVFWIGFGVAFCILVLNGLNKWYPTFPAISTQISCAGFRELELVKQLMKIPDSARYLNIKFFFAAVGLAYFLSSEASFSLGISGWLYLLAVAPLVARGVDLSRGFLAGGLPSYMYLGAYLGMGVMVLYLGRRFYWAVLKRSFAIPDARADVLPREVWAARVGIAACVVEVVLLSVIGLHPVLSAAFVLLTGLLFIVIGRINAATGLFLIQPFWNPVAIVLGLFGALAVGPQALIILALLCTVVTIDPRIAAVPLALNALRLGDLQKVKPGRLAAWMTVAIILALIAGVIVTVWVLYDRGVGGVDSGGTKWALDVAKMPFQMLSTHVDKLTEGQLEKASQPVTIRRLFLEGKAVKYFYQAMVIGLVLVLACSYLRLRFPRWPLHPVMFLVWGTPWMVTYAPSFLLAWLVKSLILKYGGQRTYLQSRGFFVGLVAGECAAAMLWAAVGVLHYVVTGQEGESFLTRE